MLPSPAGPRGLLDVVSAGYALVRAEWRRLLTVQLPVVAVLLTGGLLTGATWLVAVATALQFFAVVTGALILMGSARPYRDAVRKSLLPLAALLLAAGAVLTLLPAVPGTLGGLMLAALALGPAWLAVRTLTPRPAGMVTLAVLLGAVVPQMLVAGLADQTAPALKAPVLIAALAASSAIIAASTGAAPATPSPPAGRLWVAAAAVLALIVLTTTGIGTIDLDRGYRSTDAPSGGTLAVSWPPGQHPVVVTTNGVRFCDSDLCDDFTAHNGGPDLTDFQGTAGIGVNGAVLTAMITGGPLNGGPFIEYAHCTRAEGCRDGRLPIRFAGKESGEKRLLELAVSVAPDNELWFFVATPFDATRYRLLLIRCPDTSCTTAEQHDAGTVERRTRPYGPVRDGFLTRLSVDADGRPLASLWSDGVVHQVTCAPVTCDQIRTARPAAPETVTFWATPTVVGDDIAALDDGKIWLGVWLMLGDKFTHAPGAVARAGDTVYATEAIRGEGMGYQQVLLRCTGTDCHRTPLDSYERGRNPELLAPAADGRVLIVRDDKMVLVEHL
ncbi:hypothetical protein OHA21_14365 [Actinoplanes sp. NBC_00393]|uniref:hypothetical protein n=1 Tax=Actinoplanes sp. NBC_00393 TaxID=2975953 RepID=UPI002E21FAE3